MHQHENFEHCNNYITNINLNYIQQIYFHSLSGVIFAYFYKYFNTRHNQVLSY